MQNKQQYTPVRFSHLTSYAGVGAVVRDSNDMLMVVTDIRYWTYRNGICTAIQLPYVTRITNALGIGKELRLPPQAKELENGAIQGHYLPAVLFPKYAVCKKCGRPVCAHHFEHGAECTLCRISEFTETLNLFRTGLSNNQLRVKENPESKFWKEAVESDKGHVEFYEKLIKELKRKL